MSRPLSQVSIMSKKLYQMDERGGVTFESDRRPGEVRIPNYVYDLWMPLLGIEVIGVYAVYCRLEREDSVKGMTQADIARFCKIGVRRLNDINDLLEKHGFISVQKPEGISRIKHFTTKITVKDAPTSIPAKEIELHDADRKTTKYRPLTAWLVASEKSNDISYEKSNDISGNVKRHLDEKSNDNAKIATPILQPLEIATPILKKEKQSTTGVVVGEIHPVTTHNDLIKAWLDASEVIDPAAYAKKTHQQLAREMLKSGVTPDDIRMFIEHRRLDKFWKDKAIRLNDVALSILAWKSAHFPKPQRTERNEYGHAPGEPLATPEQLAESKALMEAILAKFGGGK